jgi:hypothetical protein
MKVFFNLSECADINFPLQDAKLSVELCCLMMMEAAQNTWQVHFATQLDSFPPPE